MTNLTGRIVRHNIFGKGIISCEPHANQQGSTIISVKFLDGEERRFEYPAAIGKYLETDDSELINQAVKDSAANQAVEDKAGNQAAAEVLNELAIEARENQLRETLDAIDHDVQFRGNAPQIFIVHQGDTYQEELDGGYLWAPQSRKFHHENMTRVQAGDIIFHYANGYIMAVSEALGSYFIARAPLALYGHGWNDAGYEVIARYQELVPPLDRKPLRPALIERRAGRYSSINRNGNANQGYLYELELDIARLFKAEIMNGNPSDNVVSMLNRIP